MTTRNQVKNRVIDRAIELVGWWDRYETDEGTRLTDDMDMDSLDLMEFAMEIEDDFGLCITDEEIEDWYERGTVGSVTDLVYAKLTGVRPANQGILRRWLPGVR